VGYDVPAMEVPDDGHEFAHEHTGGLAGIRNMGHGNTCLHCNDAVLHDMKKSVGRLGSFKMGVVEHQLRKKHGRA
jgi:hypothetical protein